MKKIDISHVLTIAYYSFIQEIRWKRSPSKKPSYRMLFSLLVMYLFSGFAVGAILTRVASPFAESFIASTFFMILALNFVVMEFSTLITGPEDYSFYAGFPVHPLSYFLGKILSVVLLIVSFGIAFSIPIAIFHVMTYGANFTCAWIIVSIISSGVMAIFLVINIIGLVVRFVRMKAVRTVASTVQFLLVFAVYGVFLLFSRNTNQYAALFSFGWNPWLIFVPSSWPSAGFVLGEGISAILAFSLSFVSIPLLVALSSRIVTVDFGNKISEIESISVAKKTTRKKGLSILWKTDEEQVVSLLLKSHFKHDQQFRMAILTIIPLSIVYFILVFVNSASGIHDPFTPLGVSTFASTIPLYVAIGFFPFYMKNALSYSSFAEASWIFYVAPYNRVKLIDAAWKFIFVFFLVPYFAIIIGAFIVMTKSVIGIMLHFFIVFLLSIIQTDIFLYFFAELPFSKKYQKGKGIFALYLRMLVAPLLPVPLFFFVYFFYNDILSFVLLVISLCIVSIIVRIMGRKRAAKRLNREEYGYG